MSASIRKQNDDIAAENEDRNVPPRVDVHNDDDDYESSLNQSSPILASKDETVEWNQGFYTFSCTLCRKGEHGEHAGDVKLKLFFQSKANHDRKLSAAGSGNCDTKGEEIGSLSGHLIKPNRNFYKVAVSISDETHSLARKFCDRYGTISRVKTGLTKKNNYGGFLHIYLMELNKDHRGCDLGLHMVHRTLKFLHELSIQGDPWDFKRWSWRIAVMVPPHASNQRLPQHFARMGFRQAGRTANNILCMTSGAYFGGNNERESCSYSLRSHVAKVTRYTDPDSAIGTWKSKKQGKKIDIFAPSPIHKPSGVNKELRDFINGLAGTSGTALAAALHEIKDFILGYRANIHEARAMHAAAALRLESTAVLKLLVRYGGNVNRPDENGLGPLHVAACLGCFPAITYLLSRRAYPTRINKNGENPLFCLQRRHQDEIDVDHDLGLQHVQRVPEVLEWLKCMRSLMPLSTQSLLVNGWLSPRMKCMFLITAEIEMNAISESSHTLFQQDTPTPLSTVQGRFSRISRASYLHPHILRWNPGGLDKSFCDGWQMMFQAILNLLRQNRVPTIRQVQREIYSSQFDQQIIHHFLSKGGKIKYALDCVLKVTENAFIDGHDGWVYGMFEQKIEAFPETALDGAFDVARIKILSLENSRVIPTMGPYNHGMDEDDDDAESGDY